MAQYDDKVDNVVNNITNSNLNQTTKESINKILNEYKASTGQENVKVDEYKGGKADANTIVVNVGKDVAVTEDPGAPVIIMSSDATQGANVTLTADVERTVVASSQADTIKFEGNSAVTVETGGGNDHVTTGNGGSLVNVTGSGDSTVETGTGNDTVVIKGEGKVHVSMVGGDNTVILGSENAEVTVSGGTGFDQVQIANPRTGSHSFAIVNGKVVMHSNSATTMDNVQVIGFDADGDGKINTIDGPDQITVVATSEEDAIMAKMYQVAFGREGDIDGLKYWMGRLDANDNTHLSLQQLADAYEGSPEFQKMYGAKSDEDFLGALYANLQEVGHAAADADGVAYWLGRLEDGTSRAEVVLTIASCDKPSQLMGIDGNQYVIDMQ